MISIDEEKIVSEIKKRRPKVVLFNAPDGLLAKTQALASKLEASLDVKAITIVDPCYGICDTVDEEAERLGADVAFHIGHNVAVEKKGEKTVLIDAIDDVAFDDAIKIAIPFFRGYERVGLCTISPHLHQLQRAKGLLEGGNIKAVMGRGRGLLRDGQVLGCDFHTAFSIRDRVEAFAFLGQSRFHAVGVALATGRRSFMLDPYYKEVLDVAPLAADVLKKAILSTYKALDATTFGIIIGLKEGQRRVKRAEELSKDLERHGKKAFLIAMREITNDRLNQLQGIDAFIQTACPRISMDGDAFDRPVLSLPQAEALISLLEGKECGEIFQRERWL